MLSAIYLIPLAAWFLFTYHMHHSGGRPTTTVWWAFMTGLGTFELGKGLFTEFGASAPLPLSFVVALAAAGVVLVIYARRDWTAPARASAEAQGSAAAGR